LHLRLALFLSFRQHLCCSSARLYFVPFALRSACAPYARTVPAGLCPSHEAEPGVDLRRQSPFRRVSSIRITLIWLIDNSTTGSAC
jgi:hypothetical protein